MKSMGGNVRNVEARRKRKSQRGVIRQRIWTGADGAEKTCWQADFGTVNGKRLMRSFAVKADAENWLHEQRLVLEDQGHAAFGLSDVERLDAVKAREELRDVADLPAGAPLQTAARTYADAWKRLREVGRTIQEAVAFMVKHHPANGEKRTIAEVAEEYARDAEEHNLRPRSIRGIRMFLKRLVAKHGQRQASEFTVTDADKWLASLQGMKDRSRDKYRRIAHGAFAFATDRGYRAAEAGNPFAARRGRRKHREDEVLPECMPWKDVQKVMAAAVEHEASMVPGLAVGFFAGVRTSELRQLEWKDVDLEARRITVMPAVAKKRRARYIQIEENLAAWLLPYRQQTGLLAPDGEKWRSRLDTVREKAGVKWPFNAMRHSYASHHLVKYSDAARTALQLGHHRDTSMLFEHYRALVKAEDAKEYFDIRPAEAGNVIAFRATASA